MKILVATEKPFASVTVNLMRELAESSGYEIAFLEKYRGTGELADALVDADALVVRSDPVTAQILDAARKLRIVVRAGSGYDNIDLNACTAHNVVVMNTPGQNANAVAELAFLMMLYKARSGFSGKTGTELRGKTLGLYGFGNVSRFMTLIANGFGMKVFAYDPYIDENIISNSGALPVKSQEEMFSKCQYVSLHIPANEQTRKLIGYNLLKLMPSKAVLVNTARKEIIDEEALLKIFEERPDFTYLSDVEPDCKNVFEEKYRGRFIFTEKKMGAQTEESNTNAGVAAIRQIIDFFKTGNDRFRVN